MRQLPDALSPRSWLAAAPARRPPCTHQLPDAGSPRACAPATTRPAARRWSILSRMGSTTSELVTIEAGKARVSGLLQLPSNARAVYVLAHGAGAGMNHPFMAAIAD